MEETKDAECETKNGDITPEEYARMREHAPHVEEPEEPDYRPVDIP